MSKPKGNLESAKRKMIYTYTGLSIGLTVMSHKNMEDKRHWDNIFKVLEQILSIIKKQCFLDI